MAYARCGTFGRRDAHPDNQESDCDEGKRIDDATEVAAQHIHDAGAGCRLFEQLVLKEVHRRQRDDVADLGVRVVRGIMPGFQPIHFGADQARLGHQRLFTAPHRWGWRDRVATRTDLNPDPHPLA